MCVAVFAALLMSGCAVRTMDEPGHGPTLLLSGALTVPPGHFEVVRIEVPRGEVQVAYVREGPVGAAGSAAIAVFKERPNLLVLEHLQHLQGDVSSSSFRVNDSDDDVKSLVLVLVVSQTAAGPSDFSIWIDGDETERASQGILARGEGGLAAGYALRESPEGRSEVNRGMRVTDTRTQTPSGARMGGVLETESCIGSEGLVIARSVASGSGAALASLYVGEPGMAAPQPIGGVGLGARASLAEESTEACVKSTIRPAPATTSLLAEVVVIGVPVIPSEHGWALAIDKSSV